MKLDCILLYSSIYYVFSIRIHLDHIPTSWDTDALSWSLTSHLDAHGTLQHLALRHMGLMCLQWNPVPVRSWADSLEQHSLQSQKSTRRAGGWGWLKGHSQGWKPGDQSLYSIWNQTFIAVFLNLTMWVFMSKPKWARSLSAWNKLEGLHLHVSKRH